MAATSTARWRRRKDERPGEILTAALACFAERGFAATRLDDVAARAGVTKGTLYLYFASKEELFKSVVRQEIVASIAQAEEMVAHSEESAAVLLERLLANWPGLIAASRIGAIPKLVLGEAGNFPELARFYLDEVVRRGTALIAGILRRGVERGEFRPALDIERAVFCVIAPVLFTMLWRHSLEPYADRPLDARALCATHLDLLLHGLSAPEPRE
ncbi:MAG TPA: TetR/AcrR family transcriptional regulator [Stellaceae bacterium]|nr:TetR/AcrR family transcriptional regulator [Stellaceae bacterium]